MGGNSLSTEEGVREGQVILGDGGKADLPNCIAGTILYRRVLWGKWESAGEVAGAEDVGQGLAEAEVGVVAEFVKCSLGLGGA